MNVCSCVAMLAGDVIFRLPVGDRDRSISIWFAGIGGALCSKFRRLRRTGTTSSWDDRVMVWRRRVADDDSNDDDDVVVPPLVDLALGDWRRVIESHSNSLLSNDMSSLSTNVGSKTLGLARLAVFGRSGCSSSQKACTRFIFGGQVPVFATFFAAVVLSLSVFLVAPVFGEIIIYRSQMS